jgi:hypothetical protein
VIALTGTKVVGSATSKLRVPEAPGARSGAERFERNARSKERLRGGYEALGADGAKGAVA